MVFAAPCPSAHLLDPVLTEQNLRLRKKATATKWRPPRHYQNKHEGEPRRAQAPPAGKTEAV